MAKNFYKNFSYKNISFEKLIFTIIGYLIRNNRESFIKHIPFVLSHRLKDFYKGFIISKYKKDLINHINDNSSRKISFLKVTKDSKSFTLNWPLSKDSLLSVIIPTKDKLSILKKCIDSIYKYKSGCNLEIIILNNNSENISTLNFLEEFKQNPKNKLIIDDFILSCRAFGRGVELLGTYSALAKASTNACCLPIDPSPIALLMRTRSW